MELKEFLKSLDDQFLKTCFEEYECLSNTGVLPSGKARKVEEWFHNEYNLKGNALDAVKDSIYYEMARRFYFS